MDFENKDPALVIHVFADEGDVRVQLGVSEPCRERSTSPPPLH